MAARGGAASAAIDAGLALMLVALPVSVSGAQAGLALASVGATVESARRRSLPRTPLDAPLLTLLGVTVLSAALSADPALSLRKVASAWVALALYVVVARFPDPAALARMLRLAVPTAVLAGAFGVVQHFTGWRLPGKPGGTLHSFVSGGRTLWFPEGGFSHYQTFANVFLMLFCVFLGLALGAGDRRARAVASVGGAVAALAVLFSYTRGVWLAALAALAVFALASARRALLPAGAACAGALLLLLLGSPALRARVRSMTDPGTNVERLLLWETTWRMIGDHPVLGVGVGNYRAAQDAYVREEVPMAMTSTHAHNIWLQVAAERGLLGLAAFCWLLGAALRAALRASAALRPRGGASGWLAVAAAAALIGFLLDGAVQNNFGDAQAALLFWLVAGIAVLCGRAAAPAGAEASA